jgi:hypothetical protein
MSTPASPLSPRTRAVVIHDRSGKPYTPANGPLQERQSGGAALRYGVAIAFEEAEQVLSDFVPGSDKNVSRETFWYD